MRPIVVILTTTAFFLGYMACVLIERPEPLKIEGTAWCLHGEYRSMEELGMAPSLPSSMIDVTGSGVRVFSTCAN